MKFEEITVGKVVKDAFSGFEAFLRGDGGHGVIRGMGVYKHEGYL